MVRSRSAVSRILVTTAAVVMILGVLLGLTAPPVAQAANDQVHISEVLAGLNGDSRIQFVEITVADGTQKDWGPQGTETVGRAMLVFFDAAGNQTGRYVFRSDPGGTANTVLIATQAFDDLPGTPTPDFILPREVVAIAGKVCFRNNPANVNANVINLCLSYGAFTGSTEGAGVPAAELPVRDVRSLRRFQNLTVFGSASNANADFVITSAPDPFNSLGQTWSPRPAQATLAVQGENLFKFELFNGNGRTCATCHVPETSFMLKPETVAALPRNNPLFIASFNLNTLTLTANSQPSDLRGVITATNGITATVLTGKAALSYWVYGGSGMTGTVTDASGNTGTIQSFTLGDLNTLENPTLLEGGRALITSNIDGFDQPAVMRKTPHLLNLEFTAPYGLSGEFTQTAALQSFSTAAVRQHAPRTLARVDGVDFRLPTTAELVALETFQLAIDSPVIDFSLDRYATTEAQKRGFVLFFAQRSATDQGGGFNCQSCHEQVETMSGAINFNTRVALLPINGADGDNLPRDPAVGEFRSFNTSPLFDIKHLGPYMHDNSVPTLRGAIEFYNSTEFQTSSNGFLVNPALFADTRNVDDLLAFMEALVVTPFQTVPAAPTALVFPDQAVVAGPSASKLVTVTNTLTDPLTITGAVLNGGSPASFLITAQAPATSFGQNQSRTISVAFDPTAATFLTSTLEITVTSATETWSYGIALNGTGIEALPPTVSALNDLTINANSSTGPLAFTVSDPDTALGSLTLTGTSSNTTLVPNASIVFGGSGANRTVTVTPAAGQSGATTITVSVSDGVSTVVDTFVLTVNAFPTITDVASLTIDEDGSTGALDFTIGDSETAAASLTVTRSSSNTALVPNASIVLGGSGANRTVTVTPLADQHGAATITLTVSDGLASASDTFLLTVNAVNDPPTLDSLGNPPAINEDAGLQTIQLAGIGSGAANEADVVVVTAVSGNPDLIPNPAVSHAHPASTGSLSYTPVANAFGTATITVTVNDGQASNNTLVRAFNVTVNAVNDAPSFTAGDDQSVLEDAGPQTVAGWASAISAGPANESGQTLAFSVLNDNNALFAVQPAVSLAGALTYTPADNAHGSASLTITLQDDGGTQNGGANTSAERTVILTVVSVNDAPTISSIADQTTDVNTATPSIAFTIQDVEGDSLSLSASSSNPTLVPNANIVFGGSGANRSVRVTPAPGQEGYTLITITVSDGAAANSETFALTVGDITIYRQYFPAAFSNAESTPAAAAPRPPQHRTALGVKRQAH